MSVKIYHNRVYIMPCFAANPTGIRNSGILKISGLKKNLMKTGGTTVCFAAQLLANVHTGSQTNN